MLGLRPQHCTAPDLGIPKYVLLMRLCSAATVYTPHYSTYITSLLCIYALLLLYIRHTITVIRPTPMLRHKILK